MARQSRATMDRHSTERLLQAAALRILRRDGLLGGLNLREVADEAGVNRGLVYHYFGSRRDLLRAALKDRMSERLAELSLPIDEPFMTRVRHTFRNIVRYRDAVTLLTMLRLDGGRIRAMPLRHLSIPRLREERDQGVLAADADVEAFLVASDALGYGYALFRQDFARELGVPVTDLDERVADVIERMSAALLGTGPKTAQSRPGALR